MESDNGVLADISSQNVDWLDVTSDSLVRKRILTSGTGGCPPKHARCLVHYVGRLAESGEVFMDSKSESQSLEPVTLVAGRDSVSREVGLNLAVATMRQGEVAELQVDPKYGYGDKGSFSFPTVPPKAQLTYKVELLGFEAANDEKEPRSMLFEERLEAAERRRADGNELFKAGQFEEAIAKYRHALSYLDEELLMQLQGFHLDKAIAVRLPILLNMAACSLRTEEYHSCVAHCSEVLREQPDNTKALFRRGRARRLLGQTEAAEEDLERAAALEPGDAAVSRELQAVRAERRRERAAATKLYKGFVDRAKEGIFEDDQGDAAGDLSGAEAEARDAEARALLAGSQGWLQRLLGWLVGGVQGWLAALFPALFGRQQVQQQRQGAPAKQE